jgi:hypothetical protein
MPGNLSESVRNQIAALTLDPARPLIICDADEVLFQFVKSLDVWLRTQDHYLDLQSFAITGNIKHLETQIPWPAEGVKALLNDFFAEGTRDETPVPGAAEALEALSIHAQIVVLTNIKVDYRANRIGALKKHGMPYPVIANEGKKGAAASALAERAGRPVIFLDDLPPNISSVRAGVPGAHIIHFVGDPRLAAMIGPAPDANHRIDEWSEVRDVVERILGEEQQ